MPTRRSLFSSLRRLVAVAVCLSPLTTFADAAMPADENNLAVVAAASTSLVSGHEVLSAVNDGFAPRKSDDHSHNAYGNYPSHGTNWVEYEWSQPVTINASAVYWWDDHRGVRLPVAARLSYWEGDTFITVPNATVDVKPDRWNETKFAELTTTKVRLDFDSQEKFSTGIIEWKVFDSGNSPAFAPVTQAGPDRVAIFPAATVLNGEARGFLPRGRKLTSQWSKRSGPGEVTFADASKPNTSAAFSMAGEYVLQFNASVEGKDAADTLTVRVESKPAVERLHDVFPAHYQIDSPFWRERLKNQIINWIPHCIAKLDDVNLPEGGIGNLIEAGKKLRGEPSKPQNSRPWANAYIFNIVESMSVALTLDAQGDKEILATQEAFHKKLDEWIPLILAAQEPDGYFQTRFTLGTPGERERNITAKHWDPSTRGEHEGYIAGYFIEAGLANFIATDGKDRRLYDAARKLADCWVTNIGPSPKRFWYDGHQEIEQAMVRLGRFVNESEGDGKGEKYIALAKFILDCRGQGERVAAAGSGDFYTGGAGASQEYDQSHRPLTQQYTAVGHAVRAAYTYSGMADISAQTGDPAYWSATLSIWDNIVNKKLYVTGGIGSGETSEGFGPDYSLANASAYVESCSSCGLLFMQHKLGLATRDAKYADLYETTLYNAILGDCDLEANNFTYTNALDSAAKRYGWHNCPCCVGNIPRVLLMLPTWTYSRGDDAVFVNLFAGSTVDIGKVAGAEVQMVQKTNYPWDGHVSITVNPSTEAKFAVQVRSPKRQVSTLYTATPSADGISSMKVNGETIDATQLADGYVKIERTWKKGDTIEMELPLPVQTITADEKVAATRGKIAIARGPLVYNIETADKQDVNKKLGDLADLTAAWSPEMLGGVWSVHGKFADGSPLTAVPNYARLNRGGRSVVWMNK